MLKCTVKKLMKKEGEIKKEGHYNENFRSKRYYKIINK